MTNQIFRIPEGSNPLYMRLADEIITAILTGTLPAGTKLPPQRDLAYDLGVTVGTVGRAYAQLRQRGLVSGEVGRGTYVAGSMASHAQSLSPGASAPAANESAMDADPAFEDGKPAPLPLRARPTSFDDQAFDREVNKIVVASPEPGQPPVFGYGSTRVALPPLDAIRLDSTSAPQVGQSKVLEAILPAITIDTPYEIASYTRTIPEGWRMAGQRWLTRGQWVPDGDTIVPTFGAQAAIMAVISAMTAPGDRIVFEELTYSSIARGARFSGRQAVQVSKDMDGPLPDHLESICRQTHPRAIFLMPTMHNPTLNAISQERREQLVEIARRYDLFIIEDEVYGALRPTDMTPLAAMAPERTFHVGSFSKTVAAGLRCGYVCAPRIHMQRLFTAHKMMTGGSSYLLCEAGARLINSGEADRIMSLVKQEIAARQGLAAGILQGADMETAPDAPYIWLKLPDPWLPGTFKAAAAERNVLIDDEDEFRTGRAKEMDYRVRIALTNPLTRDELAEGISILKQLLDDRGASCVDSYA